MVEVMSKAQEICDVEHEQILERVAAVDVAKASGMVCLRRPDPAQPGRRRSLVWEVSATTNAVLEVAEDLAAERVQKVTLEATSDYWRIWFYLLEAAGLDVHWSTPATSSKCRVGRRRTSSMRCGWRS